MKFHEGRITIIPPPYFLQGPVHLRFQEQWLTDHRSPCLSPSFFFHSTSSHVPWENFHSLLSLPKLGRVGAKICISEKKVIASNLNYPENSWKPRFILSSCQNLRQHHAPFRRELPNLLQTPSNSSFPSSPQSYFTPPLDTILAGGKYLVSQVTVNKEDGERVPDQGTITALRSYDWQETTYKSKTID